jgi:hypothetical protein
MTGSYVYINITLLHAAFYSTIQPVILIIALVSTLLMYLLKKYLILRRYSSPKKFHRLIFDAALRGLAVTPLMFGLGALMFTLMLQ